MNLDTIRKQSFLQIAKTFVNFSGKNKDKEKKTRETIPRKHKVLRKTVSLGSSGMEMTKEPNFWFDPNNDANNAEQKGLKETKEIKTRKRKQERQYQENIK